MSEPSPSTAEAADQQSLPPPPPRPGFGFLLGGTTLGIFFGCVLLCAGASPPHLIIIVLSICGAITGGVLESLWPKPLPVRGNEPSRPGKTRYHDISVSPFREDRETAPPQPQKRKSEWNHECQRCGEVFEPSVVCPMCGHTEKNRRTP